jgi:dihydroorotate dehydrogenase electron transfer subunit
MYVVRVRVPGWRPGHAGQFALLQRETSAVFLPRAFSLHGQASDEVSFLISPIGPGTEELVELSAGDVVWVLGPLGRGFPRDRMVRSTGGRLMIVAGGAGVAPFPLLIGSLAASAVIPPPTVILLGFRDAAQAECVEAFTAPVAALRARGGDVRLETIREDGSPDRRGLVTRLLAEELRSGDVVVACGAHPMCDAVWQLCVQRDCSAWFSLEAGMACGVGSCQGCVIPMADGSLARVCREGPVFAGEAAFGESAHRCVVPGGGA